MRIIISNTSGIPIYEQIKEQIKSAILTGEIAEGESLPSLRQLSKYLRISVLTVTRAYNELEEEGFVTNVQGKGSYVMPRSSEMIREQLLREIEEGLEKAIKGAKKADITNEELVHMMYLLLEVEQDD